MSNFDHAVVIHYSASTRPYPYTMASQDETTSAIKEKTGISGWAQRKAQGYNSAKADTTPTQNQLKGTAAPEEYQRLVVPSKLPESDYPVCIYPIEFVLGC
jgi:hypothetical protein